jgi:Tfp pilus assembly protein PilO
MINRISTSYKYGLVVTMTILMAALSYINLYKPAWQQYQSTMTNYREQEMRLEEIKKMTVTFESFKVKEASYIKKLKEQNLMLPNEVNSAELLFLLKQKADEVKVDFVKIHSTPDQGTTVSRVNLNPFHINVQGNQELIKKYIENLQDLKRKIIIKSFTIKKEVIDSAGKPSIKFVGDIYIDAFNYGEGS